MTSRWKVLGPALVLVAGLLAGGGYALAAITSPSTTAGPAALTQPAVPAAGAYVGSYVAKTSDTDTEGASTRRFDTTIGAPLAIDNSFENWAYRPGATTYHPLIDTLQIQDAQDGSIPMLSWECGRPVNGQMVGSDAEIVNGSEDAYINAAAEEVKAYGHPIFIRWFYEMNLPGFQNQQCLAGMGPAGYIRAWQHIWTIFHNDGATNAAFVWVVSSSTPGAQADEFYPGDNYVDWVGEDTYSRTSPPTPFKTMVGQFYAEWSTRKPIFIAETGVDGSSTVQANWLDNKSTGLFATIEAMSDIKAVDYFNAKSGTEDFDYRLTGAAVSAYAAGISLPFFANAREAESAFSVTSPTVLRAAAGQPTSSTATPAGQLGPVHFQSRVTTTGFPVPTITASGLPSGLSLFDQGVGSPMLQALDTFSPPEVDGVYKSRNALAPGSYTFTLTASYQPFLHLPARQETLKLTVTGRTEFGADEKMVAVVNGLPTEYATDVESYPAAKVTVTNLPSNFHYDATTGMVTGVALSGQGNRYLGTITAANSQGVTSEQFSLTIVEPPKITTTDAVAAYTGQPFSYTFGTIGYPAPALSLTGQPVLPAWLHFTDNKNGTATLSGTPTVPEVFTAVLHADSGFNAENVPTYASFYYLLVTVH